MLEGWTRITLIYFGVNPRVITRVKWYPAFEVIPCDFVPRRVQWKIMGFHHMDMDQYLLIPFLVGWTSIYQLFWCEQKGYKVLTHCHITKREMIWEEFIWLVIWNHGILWLSHHIGNFIIPTDELIFFRGVGIPQASFLRCKKWTQMDPQGLASELCVLVYELIWTD